MKWNRITPLALLLGCSTGEPDSATVPNWGVAATPGLTIGAGEAEPGHELATVTGARLLHGTVIIANTGSHELQRFDSTGKLLGFEGRKGNGPGEFTGIIGLSPARGDSLYVFDSENLRWSLHDGTGRYVRTLAGGAGALARPAWLYHRMMVRSAAGAPVPAWMLTVLDSLPEPRRGSPPRQAMVDDAGLLWVQDSSSTTGWAVHSGVAPAIGHVALPRGFELIQAGNDFVLGRALDSADQEIVRLYHLSRPGEQAPPATTPSGDVTVGDSIARGKLFAAMIGVMTAQEMFYSNHGAYTANADSLGARLSGGTELVLIAGDKRHWVGLLYDPPTRTTCGASVGSPAPIGWLDGSVFCGR